MPPADLLAAPGPETSSNFERGLYVHVPFCVRKCSYCDFYSRPLSSGDDRALGLYIKAVLTEVEKYRELDFTTLYLGGGTPSLLKADGLRTLVDGLRKSLDLSRISESTLEANPESATAGLLAAARACGIDRLSLGVQSLRDAELKSVERIHTASMAVQAIREAGLAGFENVSADVMLGLPGQDWQSLMITLETLVGLGVQHLSMYCLSIEPHTPLADNIPPGLPSEDDQAELYEGAAALLARRGFIHYEISNFALPGYECRHNLNYWRGGEYLGLGPAAASHLGGQRFKNRADLESYLQNPGQVEEVEKLPAREKAAEEAVLRLRLLHEGLDTDRLALKYGDENVIGLVSRLNRLVREGSLLRNGPLYYLPAGKALVSNPILAEVLED
ncbi:MAG: radical SAM family heme chaperone HemW [Dehalococcoidales bacterium]|nr:radical SAM family heme chaperone HemW [Dehalococcoidales bacterium]